MGKRLLSAGAICCGLLFALTITAHAGTLYSTGFEAPTFTTGNLTGQDGWQQFGGTSVLVETSVVKSGLQAVSVDGSGNGQSGPFHQDVTTGPVVNLSADIYLGSSTSETKWQFAGLGSGLAPFLGGVDITGTNLFLITSGFPTVATFTRDTWHNVGLSFDLNTQKYSVSLDGSTVASSVAFCGDNGPCSGAHVSSFGDGFFDSFRSGNDIGYIDNYSVSTPEPSSLMLLGTGLAGLVGLLRRKP